MTDLFPIDSTAPAPRRPDDRGAGAPLGSLVYRPTIYSRGDVFYLTVRNWSAAMKRRDVQAFRLAKLQKAPDVIGAAADDVAGLIRQTVGVRGFTVTCVPCGHSRDPACFGRLLAEAAADRLGAPFLELWAFRPVKGVSHPKEFKNLPPLVWTAGEAPSFTVVVDDLATSGYHMTEALADLRGRGGGALGVAWIAGRAVI